MRSDLAREAPGMMPSAQSVKYKIENVWDLENYA